MGVLLLPTTCIRTPNVAKPSRDIRRTWNPGRLEGSCQSRPSKTWAVLLAWVKLFSMKVPERIKVDPEIMMGKPCVRGTRLPVYVLLQKMAAGETEAELLEAYPQLSKADLTAVWEYAARAAAEEVVLAET